MKRLHSLAVALLTLCALAAIIAGGTAAYLSWEPASDSRADLRQDSLASFTIKVMDICGAGGSPGRKLIQAEQIGRIAEQILQTRELREAFVILICIESKFNDAAKSSVGAVGLTQLMPKYVKDFAEICGVDEVDESDLATPEINLRLGACYFRHLIAVQEGSVMLALASYNAGMSSTTVQKMKALSTGAAETSGYVARFSILRERMDRVQGEFVAVGPPTREDL